MAATLMASPSRTMTTTVMELASPIRVESVLDQQDRWLETCDLAGFRAEIDALGKELADGQGEEGRPPPEEDDDVGTIASITRLGNACRWTMIGHHVCHGGYDKADTSGRFHRFRFAVGSLYRRVVDWLDWMLPEAWNIEHNKFHHYNLNEEADPDLVEANLDELRKEKLPMFVKQMVVIFYMLTWKWLYYAPNTFSQMRLDEARREGKEIHIKDGERPYVTILSVRQPPAWLNVFELFFRVLMPYFVWQFVLMPAPLYFIFGLEAFQYGMINLVLAELLTNFHAFVAIVTNHAGDDLYRFDTKCQPRSDHFYLRQVIGSADFTTGGDLNDFMHGFLNYQVEHHLWPALSMLSYQRSQPRVRAICQKYGIPYVQESVFKRLKKTVDIMTGKTSMRRFPVQYNPKETTSSETD